MLQEISIEEQAANINNLTFGDDRLGVLFYNKVVEDPERTLEEGRKCFREEEWIKIMVPGDRQNVVERPVQRTGMVPTDDRMRFSRQYERFKQSQAQVAHDGTPLTLWPQMPAALAEELRYINIFSVEQLAELSDTYVSKVPKGYEWKTKAAQFVLAMKDQAQVNRLQLELDKRDVEINALKDAVKDQAARIEKLLKKMEK